MTRPSARDKKALYVWLDADDDARLDRIADLLAHATGQPPSRSAAVRHLIRSFQAADGPSSIKKVLS